jgi:hypothetical protein
MAFNPFTSFRKYQKFWMATLVLLSMVTFVMCAGIGQGGLEDILIRIFGRKGREVAKLDGRAVTAEQIAHLREMRNIANEYMRKAADLSFHKLKEIQKELAKSKSKSDSKHMRDQTMVTAMLADLDEVLKKPRYFEGGTKLNDLLDFMLWQKQADRLGIRLEQAQVAEMIQRGVHGHAAQITAYESRIIQNRVREAYFTANDQLIMESLRQEFRVRIAQLALVGIRPYAILAPQAVHLQRKIETRAPLTPEQLWQFYRKNVSKMDIALLPVPASRFLDKVKAPNDVQLESLFERHKGDKFDPTSPLLGFEAPPQVKISWVTADPGSDLLKGLARLATTLETSVPVPGAPALAHAAWRAALERNYDSLKLRRGDRYADVPLTDLYTAVGLYTRLHELYGKPKPEVVAALVGSATLPGLLSGVPGIYQAAAYLDQGSKLDAVLEAEARRRAPLGVQLILAGATPTPFSALALLDDASRQEQHLPFAVVEKELREAVEHNVAIAWAQDIMADVKKALEQDRGNARSFELRLRDLQRDKYPALEVHSTGQFLNQFDLSPEVALRVDKEEPGKAAALKELAGLRESFEKYREQINQIEGRAGTERLLKEDDFYRLFFSSGEPFSVGNTSVYDPRMWPPIVSVDLKKLSLQPDLNEEERPKTINLWASAEKPILFWKSDARTAARPDKLATVRQEVERAYKLSKAREEFALPRAREIAQALRKLQPQRDPALYLDEMKQAAAKLGVDLIRLTGVAPLEPAQRPQLGQLNPQLAPFDWQPYTLPKGLILYPGADMTKELLSLGDLQAAVEIPLKDGKKDVEPVIRELNRINKDLFDPALKGDSRAKQVQILTNRPRTVFYVAAVTAEHPAEPDTFVTLWRGALEGFGFGGGAQLLERAQEQAGRDFLAAFIKQLRKQAEVEITDSTFDADAGG